MNVYHSTQHSKSQYRPEIDGLRAIAVLAVLFYHLQIPGFDGGFIGVDVFFVISGYLITKKIILGLKTGNFRLSSFYTNRIRRLFPALFVTVTITVIIGIFLLTPEHLNRLGKSSISSIFSFSNIFFWTESGYFDDSKYFKPLLHTWSLSVEEQFYLAWSLILTLLVGKKYFFVVMLSLAIVSLLLAEAFIMQNADTVFYWMPLRLFEFSLGGVLIYFDRTNVPKVLGALLGIIGLSLILAPIVFYSDTTVFPGINALPPCIGAALLLASGKTGIIQKALSVPLAVRIGLISYSLYLVHWPIIVYVRYWKLGGIGLKSLLVVLPVIFISAYLLNRFVEKRFRYAVAKPPSYSSRTRTRRFLSLSAITLGVALSLSIIWGKGWIWRYPAESKPVIQSVAGLDKNDTLKKEFVAQREKKYIGTPDSAHTIIIGDSFAQDAYIALSMAFPDLNLRWIQILAECQPVLADDYPSYSWMSKSQKDNCSNRQFEIFNSEELLTAETIILAASWREPALTHLEDTLNYLTSNTTATILVFGARATYHDVPTLAIQHGKLDGLNKFVQQYEAPGLDSKISKLSKAANNAGALYINIFTLMCPNRACPIISPEDGKIMYSDHAHWTMSGAEYAGGLLEKHFPQIGK